MMGTENESELSPSGNEASIQLTKIESNGNGAADQVQLPHVMDKGYAWVVAALMWISNVCTAGYIKSFGITYNALLELYPDTSAGAGSIIVGLLAGCRSLLALVVGAASVQFGFRPVMTFGVFLCSTGLFLAFFCNSIATLALTLGALMGTGMCCIETPQVIIIAEYFSEKKELANSIRVSGNPLGGAVVPFFLVLIFNTFGVQLSFIVLSGVLLQLLVIVSLMRPYKTTQLIAYNSQVRKRRREAIANGETAALQINENVKPTQKAKRLDFKLLKNPLYLTHVAMITFYSLALPHFQYFIPLYGRSIFLTPTQNSIILAYQSVADTTLRLTLGALLNHKIFKKTHAFTVCLVTGGVGISLMPLTAGLWSMLVPVTLFSFGSAGFYTNINCILIDQFGKNNISSSWGFIRMLQGMLNFLYPPFLGLMVDLTGNFILTFLMMGGGMAAAGLCIGILQPIVFKVSKTVNIEL